MPLNQTYENDKSGIKNLLQENSALKQAIKETTV